MTMLATLFARPTWRGWMLAIVSTAAAALIFIGYRAVTEWQHAASLVAARRAQSAVELLETALTRDMRGAQRTILASADRDGLTVGPPIDLMQPIANGLARYPYVDSFFAWSEQRRADPVEFYVRSSRRPYWLEQTESSGAFPIVVGRSGPIAMRLMNRVRIDAAQGRRFSVFDLAIGGSTYQVVTILSYADTLRERPSGVLGYMVDLGWAREHYFAQLTSEVAAIDGTGQGLRFTIARRDGEAIVGPLAPAGSRLPMATREFPMTFFDPLLVSIDPPSDLLLNSALATAIADNDITLATAERGARRTLALAGVTAVVLIAGLVLSLQAGRATARLADMRSDFVSAVTHELKAPIANLRAIHQTLASGRLDARASREYAQMGVREATRLGRLVENLLAYARVTDVADLYTFEAVPLKRVVEDSVQEFAAHLADANFELRVDVPDSLPAVHADPVALELLLNNLIDNAIRYSTAERVLTISARDAGAHVVMSVADRGIGIADEDRAHVTKKFFRGRHPGAAGSGLGLAIVDRIVKDHAGTLEINSTEGEGTTVVISLPRAA